MFVHLGAIDKLRKPHSRTQAILKFINHHKLPMLQKSPDPQNKDWMKELLDEISTSIKVDQQEPYAKWNDKKIEKCNKASVIDQFLFCPIKTSSSQHHLPKLSEKTFTKHVPFMIDFDKKLKVATIHNQVQLHQ